MSETLLQWYDNMVDFKVSNIDEIVKASLFHLSLVYGDFVVTDRLIQIYCQSEKIKDVKNLCEKESRLVLEEYYHNVAKSYYANKDGVIIIDYSKSEENYNNIYINIRCVLKSKEIIDKFIKLANEIDKSKYPDWNTW